MAEFTMKSNVQLTMKGVSRIEKMLRAVAGDSLRQLGPQVKNQGARVLKSTNYSNMSVMQYRNQIAVSDRANAFWPLEKQYVKISFSGKGMPLTAFNPRTVPVDTRVGKRYAVDVTVYGKTIRTDGFHLKGSKPLYGGPAVHTSPYTAMSKVFQRKGRDRLPIRRFLFISPGRLLETTPDAEKDLYEYGYNMLDRNLMANWRRREGQMLRGFMK